MRREGASRRDVVRGMAFGAAGVCLGPMISFAAEGQKPGRLPRTSPKDAGVDPAAVAAFVDEVNAKVGGLHSMMLLRHGKVAAEAWWKPYSPDTPHVLYSLSKSFTSTAIGFCVAEGLVKTDDKVVSFFPDKLPAEVGENLAAMRVYDLLTMSTGHETEPGRNTDDWVKEFLAHSVPHKPGSKFLYNTSATHVLAAIVQKVTKGRVLDYLTPRLFQPLGIEGATWEQSPAGIDTGGFGLKLKTEDIAKFGQLLLQKGEWHGKRVVPASWIEEATKRQVSNGDPSQENDWSQGYGFQFWRCQHGNYRGDGAFGQYCIVMPAHDAVLAITSGVGDMGAVLKAAWTHLLPALRDDAPSAGADALKEKLAAQEVPVAEGVKESAIPGGKTYKMEPNAEQIETIRFEFDGSGGTIVFTGGPMGSRIVPFKNGEWAVSPMGVASSGGWTVDNRLRVKTILLDSPHGWVDIYVFDGDVLKVEDRAWTVMFGPLERPSLSGRA